VSISAISTRTKTLIVVFAPLLSLAAQTPVKPDNQVTPVRGESWIKHLNRTFNTTSMGKTWSLGPPPTPPGEKAPYWQLNLSPSYATQTVTLHGSDVYRLNCRACHQETGLGAPPEIHSVIDPVRAASVDAIMERMKKIGMDMSRADAHALAQQANAALLERLHKGGHDMPPFPQLCPAEIRALIPYLKQLAGIPGAEKQQTVAVESGPLRIGEQIVKSTCHTCHDGVGPDPNPGQIMNGAIPPLSTLTSRVSMPDFIRKVTVGAPIIMGSPPLSYRGRMSVFYYLTQDEAASAYLYLSLYPPQS
jgi:mono/diheme cytochrome c family protein